MVMIFPLIQKVRKVNSRNTSLDKASSTGNFNIDSHHRKMKQITNGMPLVGEAVSAKGPPNKIFMR